MARPSKAFAAERFAVEEMIRARDLAPLAEQLKTSREGMDVEVPSAKVGSILGDVALSDHVC